MMEIVVQILQIVMTVFCNDITVFYIVVKGLVALTALTSACMPWTQSGEQSGKLQLGHR